MPDPFSLATGLVGLIGSLVKLNEVRGDIFEAKNEIEGLFREVDSLMNVLTRLQNLKRMPNSLSGDLLSALRDCDETARKTHVLLLRSSLSQFPSLYWAYTGKNEVLQRCRELGAQKATIAIYLDICSLHVYSEAGDKVDQVNDKVERLNDKVDQILEEIKDLRSGRVLPDHDLTLRRFQSYTESVTRRSSLTYVDEEFEKLPENIKWVEFPIPIHSIYENDNANFRGSPASDGRYALRRRLCGHSSGVSSVAFSKYGTQLLSGSWDGCIRLWDVEAASTLRSIQAHSDDATSVLFVGDETVLASASSDRSIKFWDAKTGSLLQRLGDHKDRVSGLAYAKYSGDLASASEDGTIRLCNLETGSAVRVLHGGRGGIWSVAISEDGRQVVSGSGDGTISIWDTRAKSFARTLKDHTDGVRSIAISGERLASGSWDRTIMLWDTRTGSRTRTLHTNDKHITSVVYVGWKWLASGSGDESTFKLWDTETGLLAHELCTGGGGISSLAFSVSSGQLASGSGDRTIGLWNESFGSG